MRSGQTTVPQVIRGNRTRICTTPSTRLHGIVIATDPQTSTRNKGEKEMRTSSRWITLGIAFLFVLSGTTGTVTVTAQDGGSSFDLAIVAANCEHMPTAFPFQGGGCNPANGAVIVVTTNDGNLIGTCIAQSAKSDAVIASCSVAVPFNSSIVVTEDVRSIIVGYAPAMNPQTIEIGASPPEGDFAGPVFLNLPTSPSGSANLSDPAVGAVATNTPEPLASGVTLPPPIMAGNLGDIWMLHVNQNTFFWAATKYGWIAKPSPRYVAQPRGAWFVVLLDVGTHDSFVTETFPYEAFALTDQAGNVYLPNFIATAAYCESYCDMDIQHQSFDGWRDHTFHQALVFDIPLTIGKDAADGLGLTLRSLDGLVAVSLRH